MVASVVLMAAPQERTVLSRAEIRAAPMAIEAGARVPVGIRFTMAPGWHTYAEDPGDSGMPPEITLKGPDGVRLERWQFPPAKRFTDAAGTTFGYANEVVLIGAVHLPTTLPDDDPLELSFSVVWMVCKEACVPLEETLVLNLRPKPPPAAKAFADWERFLEAGGWSACVENSKAGEVPARTKEDAR